jgi:predicted ribosome-associated RNA-binding protein Tma20
MDMADILATSKGMGIDNLHNMDDGLWRTTLIGR